MSDLKDFARYTEFEATSHQNKGREVRLTLLDGDHFEVKDLTAWGAGFSYRRIGSAEGRTFSPISSVLSVELLGEV